MLVIPPPRRHRVRHTDARSSLHVTAYAVYFPHRDVHHPLRNCVVQQAASTVFLGCAREGFHQEPWARTHPYAVACARNSPHGVLSVARE